MSDRGGDRRFRELVRLLRGDNLGPEVDWRVMARVRREPAHGASWFAARIGRAWAAAVRRPAIAAAAGIVLVAGAALLGKGAMSRQPEPGAAPARHSVQFVLVAPSARKVAVVGDFNDWDAADSAFHALHRGGGVWTLTAMVPPGHHRYSFLVDDSVWVADPNAPMVQSDRVANSVIIVGEDRD